MGNENETGIMMVQLLFKGKPMSPTAEQFRTALEKRLGDLGEMPYAETARESAGDMFMFPIPGHKVVMQDRPEGVPVMAVFLGSTPGSGLKVDEAQRLQLWDVPNGRDLIDECTDTILVNTALGAALPYREQAEVLLAQVDAALECYPECIGIFAAQSGKLITPEMFLNQRKFSLSERFIQLFVNARFFNIPDAGEMIIDTLGFNVFGGADVQVHFKDMNPNHVVDYVYNIASYQFDNNFPIKSGDIIDGIDENGQMQTSLQWKGQYEDSMVDPMRNVLDIACGEHAGGIR